MNALDTNVLLRYLIGDDEIQSVKAAAWIKKNCTASKPGFISLVVLSEAVWVMKRFYKFTKDEICQYLRVILLARELQLEGDDLALVAFSDYIAGTADFADYLIKHSGMRHGTDHVVTFDERAGKEKGFFLLK